MGLPEACYWVAIPLGQGQVFNDEICAGHECAVVAIPLGQGQVFNQPMRHDGMARVAIPLGQGQVFNFSPGKSGSFFAGRNPFGSGTGF